MLPSWDELGKQYDAQRAAAARERSATEQAHKATQAKERQNMAEAKRLVGQFLEAMRKAGNPGLAKEYLLFNPSGYRELTRRRRWSSHGVQVDPSGSWILMSARDNTFLGDGVNPTYYVTDRSEFCNDSDLAKLKFGLAAILRNNNVSLPRD